MRTDRHLLRLLMGVCGGLLIVAGIGEAIARFGLGLGSPPLSVAHPRIEYLFRPNQELKRFGNRIAINAYGMRSDLIGEHPPAGVRRVLVFGDSVVFGGAQLDQSLIATERLQASLRRRDPRVQVGNVSAGSWGPGNWLGWVRTYGFLEATDVILVLSSHDLSDNPTFGPLNPGTHPTANPPLALSELFQRYLPRLLPFRWPSAAPAGPGPKAETMAVRSRRGGADLATFFDRAAASGARLAAVQFWELAEIRRGRPDPRHGRIAALLGQRGIPVVQAGPLMQRCATSLGVPLEDLFVDNLHPFTPSGQRCLAEALRASLDRASATVAPPKP